MKTMKHNGSIYTHTETDGLPTNWCFTMCSIYKPEVSSISIFIFIIFLP